MAISVTMPRLGESVSEGTVTRWLKQEGDRVEADEPLLEVSTDKVDTEIPAPASGVLERIVVHEDETAEVGSELAVISGGDESGGSAAPAREQAQEPAREQAQEQAQESTPAEASAEAPPTQEAPAESAEASQEQEPAQPTTAPAESAETES